MQKIKAVFFDLDGTLIDSERFHYDCWNELLVQYGIKTTFEQWIKDSAGIALPTNAARLVREYNLDISPEELVKKRLALTEENLKKREVDLMPYAREFVELLTKKGIDLVVVTSSLRDEVDLVFENSSLRTYFKYVITRDDVTQGKPNPEPYEKAWKMFPGVAKDECLIFEDTITGATAGTVAGIPCFAIQHVPELQGRLNFADKVFSDLEEAKNYLVENNFI